MKSAIITVEGATPYSQSKCHEAPRLPKELPNDYEERTWRERLHVDRDGFVIIPSSAVAQCLRDAAKFLAIKVPGRGKETFTKHFDAGLQVENDCRLPVRKEDVTSDRLFVPADGKPGGGRRVWKRFPRIDTWGGDFLVIILDDVLTRDVVHQVAVGAGTLVGLGRFRPRNRGNYGRFVVRNFVWHEEDETKAALGLV